MINLELKIEGCREGELDLIALVVDEVERQLSKKSDVPDYGLGGAIADVEGAERRV